MRRFIAVALVVAACGGSPAPSTTTETSFPAPTTAPVSSGSATSPAAPSAERVLEVASRLLEEPTEINVSVLAQEMAATGDERWVPYLVDLIRLIASEDVFNRTAGALEALTGVESSDRLTAWATFGMVMYERSIDPGIEYLDWKSSLYGLIDPAFSVMLATIADPVLASRIQWGGVVRGAIPELNDPATIAVAEADYMTDDELTFGTVVGGQARSYPHRIMDFHELANDTLGGEPVAMVDCTLCRTGVMFSRVVDGEVLDFQTSGFLLNSNKVMVDNQTNSLWNQLSGEAFAGPMTGTRLERFPLVVTTWGDWTATHPDTDVVAIPDGPYSYRPGEAQAEYYASEALFYPALGAPDVFRAKEEMLTVELDGAHLAVSVAALEAAGPQVLAVGDAFVVAVPSQGGGRAYLADSDSVEVAGATETDGALVLADGAELPRIISGQSFWFAWYGNYPDTAFWPQA